MGTQAQPSRAGFAPLSSIRAGDQARLQKTITSADIDAFAALSGDFNPLHMDDAFAGASSFQRRVAHGMLAASYVSTLIGMRIPGPGSLWMQQNFRWPAPVFIGDTIEVLLTVTHISESTRIVSVGVETKNQNGKVVMQGEGKVMLLEESRQEELVPAEERVAFVSGGSGAVTSAIARTLARAGMRVAVNCRGDRDAAEDLCESIVAMGGSAIAASGDVAVADDLPAAVDSVSSRFGNPVDILIHDAAAASPAKSFLDMSWEDVQREIDANVRSAFHCCKAVLPGMLQSNGGVIVHIGAAMTWGVPPANWSAFVMAKAALKSLTKSLASEFGPRGIRVNMISPGMTESEAIADIPERMRKLHAMQTPLRRLGRPEDIARTALFLCSPAGAFITGADIPVCGGIAM